MNFENSRMCQKMMLVRMNGIPVFRVADVRCRKLGRSIEALGWLMVDAQIIPDFHPFWFPTCSERKQGISAPQQPQAVR